MKSTRIAVVIALVAALLPLAQTTPARAEVDVYTTEGRHTVNGREWRTTCEPYSQTERCTTLIWATTVVQTGSGYEQRHGWVFNSLTMATSSS